MSVRGALALAVVCLFIFMTGLLVSYARFSEDFVLEAHVSRLMREKANSIQRYSMEILGPPEAVAVRAAELLGSGDLAEEGSEAVERFLFHQLVARHDITGAYVGWPNGNFVYVKRQAGPGNAAYRTLVVDRSADGLSTAQIWRASNFALVDRQVDIGLDYDPRERPWYQGARDATGPVWTAPYLFNTSRNPGVTVSAPARDAAQRLKAVIGIDKDIALFSALLGDLRLPQGGSVFISTADGRIVAAAGEAMGVMDKAKGELPRLAELPDGATQAALAALPDGVRGIATGSRVFSRVDVQGVGYQAYFSPLEGGGPSWVVSMVVPESVYLSELLRSRNVHLAIGLGALALGALATFLWGGALLRPIQELSSVATAVREGGFGPMPLIKTRFTEIENLRLSFRSLLAALENREHHNEALTEELRSLNRDLEGIVADRTQELMRKNAELQILATTDTLTGTLNRRAFTEAAEAEIARCVRYDRPLTLAMLDIDHFKRINDTHGHGVGDGVLAAFADHCRRHLREQDLLGRLGGEEFAILLPETAVTEASLVADRMRAGLELFTLAATEETEVCCTVSIGLAGLRPGDDYDSIIARADAALYRAKDGGRNRYVVAA